MYIIMVYVVLAVAVWHTCSVEGWLVPTYNTLIESVRHASVKLQLAQVNVFTSSIINYDSSNVNKFKIVIQGKCKG